MTDLDEALRYAEQTGNSLFTDDGEEYDASAIRSAFFDADGSPRLEDSES